MTYRRTQSSSLSVGDLDLDLEAPFPAAVVVLAQGVRSVEFCSSRWVLALLDLSQRAEKPLFPGLPGLLPSSVTSTSNSTSTSTSMRPLIVLLLTPLKFSARSDECIWLVFALGCSGSKQPKMEAPAPQGSAGCQGSVSVANAGRFELLTLAESL